MDPFRPKQKPDMSNYAQYANDILKMSVGLMDMDPRYDANQDGVVNTQDSTRIQQMFQEGTPFSLDQNPVDQGIGTDFSSLLRENQATDPAERERLLESLIGDRDYQQRVKDIAEGGSQTQQESRQKAQDLALQQMEKPEPTADFSALRGFFGEEKFPGLGGELDNFGPGGVDPRTVIDTSPQQPQQPITKNPNIEAGYYDSPEYKELRNYSGADTMDMLPTGSNPYFGSGGSSSASSRKTRSYEDYLNRTGNTGYLRGGVNYKQPDAYTDYLAEQEEGRLGLEGVETGDGRLPEFNTPVADMDPTQITTKENILAPDTGQAGGSPPAATTPAIPGTEVVPANPTAPPTTSAPPTETPGIPNLSDGIGAQLRQLFQQYMGGGQRNRNNYSNPMQQYRTAVTDTDEYKAYNDYASGLGPTEEQKAELQRLQSAFEGTDAYGQFNQQRQQRRNYMQPLGYGGGYGSGYGGGFQGGFGGYGGGYGGYQQPSYQQPYYQPPMQQQPYYGGGIMGGSSYGYPNNYSSYQQPYQQSYQQPYQMAQQYQSYGSNQQPYGSVQPQYPAQFSSYASPFANSIR